MGVGDAVVTGGISAGSGNPSANVNSVTNTDGLLSVTPTTGAVVVNNAGLAQGFTTVTPVATTPQAMTAGVLYVANTGASVFNLPATISEGQVFGVQRGTLTTTITITANTGQTINGGASGGSVAMLGGAGGAPAGQGFVRLLATSASTYVVIAAVDTDAQLGMNIGGALKVNGTTTVSALLFSGTFSGHALTKSATYTTLFSDWWIRCTSGTFTLTMGATSFAAGQQQLVTNEGAGIITLAAASGTIDNTTLPPNSGVAMMFDGTNWHTVGSYGLGGYNGDTGWTAVSLVNSWANVGGGNIPAQYRKLAGGLVIVELAVQSGTTTTVTTLPAGYRPSATITTTGLGLVSAVLASVAFSVTSAGVLTATTLASGVPTQAYGQIAFYADA